MKSLSRTRGLGLAAGLAALAVAGAVTLPVVIPRPVQAFELEGHDGHWVESFYNPCISPKICADWYDGSDNMLGSCCIVPGAMDSGSLLACVEGLRPRSELPVLGG